MKKNIVYEERRLAAVGIAFELLIQMLKEGFEIEYVTCKKGLPRDAVYVGDFYDPVRQEAFFIFSHESFNVVEPGQMVPILDMVYERRFVAKGE